MSAIANLLSRYVGRVLEPIFNGRPTQRLGRESVVQRFYPVWTVGDLEVEVVVIGGYISQSYPLKLDSEATGLTIYMTRSLMQPKPWAQSSGLSGTLTLNNIRKTRGSLTTATTSIIKFNTKLVWSGGHPLHGYTTGIESCNLFHYFLFSIQTHQYMIFVHLKV